MKCEHFNTGYRGQKYEVLADMDSDGKQSVVGWTDEADGGSLVKMVNLHPVWKNPVVRAAAPSVEQKGETK